MSLSISIVVLPYSIVTPVVDGMSKTGKTNLGITGDGIVTIKARNNLFGVSYYGIMVKRVYDDKKENFIMTEEEMNHGEFSRLWYDEAERILNIAKKLAKKDCFDEARFNGVYSGNQYNPEEREGRYLRPRRSSRAKFRAEM
jgi:hypothetical protein